MKKLMLAAITIITATALPAQVTLHANVGAQNSNWNGNGMQAFDKLINLGSDYLKQGSFTSFYTGISASIPIASHLSIEPGLQYSKVGATLTGNIEFKALSLLGINASARAVSHRIEMPILLKAELAKGLYVVAGPQLNYSYSNQLQLKAGFLGINALNKKINIDNMYEPFGAAALGGLQYQFPGGMQLQALYEYGITKIVKNGSVDIHQNNLKIGIGIPLNFLNRSSKEY